MSGQAHVGPFGAPTISVFRVRPPGVVVSPLRDDWSAAPLTLPRAPVPRTEFRAASPERAAVAGRMAAPAQIVEPVPDAAVAVAGAVTCRGVTAKGFPCTRDATVGRYCETCIRRQTPVRRPSLARVSPLGAVLVIAFVYTIYKLVTTGVYLRMFDF